MNPVFKPPPPPPWLEKGAEEGAEVADSESVVRVEGDSLVDTSFILGNDFAAVGGEVASVLGDEVSGGDDETL